MKVVTARYRILLLLAGVVLTLGIWKSETLAGKKHDVPFQASFETESVVVAPPPILQLRSTGQGIGLHIGNSTLVAFPTINLTTPPPFAVTGTMVITAANGDEIFASFAGTRSAPDSAGNFTIDASYQITGGTGRFEDASGSFEGITLGRLGSTAGSASYEGSIAY